MTNEQMIAEINKLNKYQRATMREAAHRAAVEYVEVDDFFKSSVTVRAKTRHISGDTYWICAEIGPRGKLISKRTVRA
jgi:hypothetical protein